MTYVVTLGVEKAAEIRQDYACILAVIYIIKNNSIKKKNNSVRHVKITIVLQLGFSKKWL